MNSTNWAALAVAVAMSASSADAAPPTDTGAVAPADTAVSPDLLKTPDEKRNPHWVNTPVAGDFIRFYPERAVRLNMSGRAVLKCSLTAEGRLTDCSATATPVGFGFEDAALRLSVLFRMSNKDGQGKPIAIGGGHVTIPIRFNAP